MTKEISFYKLRFIPTGDFYKPSRGYSWQKTNLSKQGKTYTKKALSWEAVNRICVPVKVLPDRENVTRFGTHDRVKIIETLPKDWEWVEYKVVESGTLPINHG